MNFTIPTMIMMVFLSLYTIIDGIFVSRFVGQAALSAINITLPLSTLTWGVAIMFATGGSAIVAKKLGEGKTLEAKQNFTLIVICSTIIGIVLMLIELIFLDPIIKSLGATDTLFSYCKEYLLKIFPEFQKSRSRQSVFDGVDFLCTEHIFDVP